MGAYILHRLLLMIPTFLGILVINFAILRINGVSLTEQMLMARSGTGSGAVSSGGGEAKAGGASRNIENYIDRFRRAGNDLPALINTRGWMTKQRVVGILTQTSEDSPLSASRRSQLEKDLWLSGHFAVKPLYEVLADDALQPLHARAAVAYCLCAYTTIGMDQVRTLSSQALNAITTRNEVLHRNRFDSLADPAYAEKRQALLAVYRQDPTPWRHSQGAAWSALVTQTGFVDFMGKLFTGRLWSETKQDYAFTVIGKRWYISFGLNITSIILSWVISILIGIRSARRSGSLEDRATTNVLFLLYSVPSFFLGTLLLHHLCTSSSGHAPWFPNRDLTSPDAMWFSTPHYLLDLLWHATLPLVVLTYGSFTVLSRYMRGNVLEQLRSDHIRTARAKGCTEDQVVYRHAVRNSLLTLITLGGSLLADLFGGFVVVEYIFSIQGLGTLLLEAARDQDAPLIMASTVVSVGLLLGGILVADLLYGVVDPRIRSRYG